MTRPRIEWRMGTPSPEMIAAHAAASPIRSGGGSKAGWWLCRDVYGKRQRGPRRWTVLVSGRDYRDRSMEWAPCTSLLKPVPWPYTGHRATITHPEGWDADGREVCGE